ncbi:hypothetical protein Poli38472_005527 [Pythium oligandrum]|uniref:PI3K/PI4K catalytic domain-containing protein n=1 Tax=Pythium oligandrum TaxID=41045 RepID=A0A8K1FJA2_PYTOL|nr:hypothetical protein Poli38472_005527 [Pythium oligandrum]|eukprot:TMW62909.1 hypothetical protein Poli38472_005527 [Pythium oligandrum]
MVKLSPSSAIGGGGASAGGRLSHVTLPSRRSEPKLHYEQPAKSSWRLTRWPSSPVKRFSAVQALASPVQAVKQCFFEKENNQVDSLPSPSVPESSNHDSTLSSLWRRHVKGPQDDVEPEIDGIHEHKVGATIDLSDLRGSLATIRVPLKPVESIGGSSTSLADLLAEEFGESATLTRSSVVEELEEFRRHPEDKVKVFPEYFSSKEKDVVKHVAETLRLGCQFGEKNVSVFKTGSCENATALHTLRGRFRSVSEPVLHDEVYVDVPSLAQHGKDGFIARLRLRRLDSGGGVRRNMLWDVAQLSSTDGVADPVSEGDGGVYAVQSRTSGEKLAMFKPAEEEKFVREGIIPGEGAVREEAAYVLDSGANGFSGVPATAVARLHLANIGKAKQGAVQRFMMGSIGSMESYGMPFDLEKARAFVPVEQVHRVGLLDIRTFNTDRHPGNILLIGDKAPYTMIPIDHGCILPSWFHLSEARFDWLEYPQCKVPFSDAALAYIDSLDAEHDANTLRKLGIREECVTTLKICTLFMKLAAKAGRTLHWMGSFMQRDGCFENPSALEHAIHQACEATGIPFSFVPNEFNEQKGQITLGILSRRPPSVFFKHLERLLRDQIANTES